MAIAMFTMAQILFWLPTLLNAPEKVRSELRIVGHIWLLGSIILINM